MLHTLINLQILESQLCIHNFNEDNRSGNRVSNTEEDTEVNQTVSEDAEYPDLLNGNQSTSIGSNNNE